MGRPRALAVLALCAAGALSLDLGCSREPTDARATERAPGVGASEALRSFAPADDIGWARATSAGFPSFRWLDGGLSGIAALAPLDGAGARTVGLGRVRRLQLRITLDGARASVPLWDRGRLLYRDVLPSTDSVLLTDEGRFEEWWVLRDALAPTSFTWRIEPGDDIVRVARDGDGLAFFDRAGDTVLRLPAPVAVDANGVTRAVSIGGDIAGFSPTFSVDPAGLSFPIMVDPGLVESAIWQPKTVTTMPPARSWHAMAYLPSAGRVVMHGGVPRVGFPFSAPDETWAWNGTDWTQLSFPTAGPESRAGESMVTLPSGEVLLVGGHAPAGAATAEVWTLGGTEATPKWTNLTGAGQSFPSARSGISVAPGPGGEIIAYGGGARVPTTANASAESFRRDAAQAWVTQPSAGGPAVRDAALLSIPELDVMLLFGGHACADSMCAALGTPLIRTGGKWGASTLQINGTPPPLRWGASVAYDSVRKRAVLYGGSNGTKNFQDVWEFTGKRWYPRTTAGIPTFGAYAAMAFDPARNEIVMFGGRDGAGLPDDGSPATVSFATWTLTVKSSACTFDTQCTTGHCVDGACCDVAACGPCEMCNSPLEPGYCAPIQGAPDPDTCASGTCYGGGCCPAGCEGPCASCASGQCGLLPPGDAPWTPCPGGFLCGGTRSCPTDCKLGGCATGTCVETAPGVFACQKLVAEGAACKVSTECETGFCVDGVCCDNACTGGCATCAVAGGALKNGTCDAKPAGAGNCSTGEVCDGASMACIPSGVGGGAGAAGAAGGSGTAGAGNAGAGNAGAGGGGAGGSTSGAAGSGAPCAAGAQRYSDGRCYDTPKPIDAHRVAGCDVGGSPGGEGAWLPFATLFAMWAARRRGGHRALVGGPPRVSRVGWGAWLALPVVAAGGGCSREMANDEACVNANYAIASRTQACTGDVALSNRRYEDATKGYRCTVTEPKVSQFLCASGINNLDCEQVERYGDDYDRWYAASVACASIFQRADGSALPSPYLSNPSPSLDASPVCQAALASLGARWGKCVGAPFSAEESVRAAFNGKYGCAAPPDADPKTDPCVADAPNIPCAISSSPTATAEAFRHGSPACELLFPQVTP